MRMRPKTRLSASSSLPDVPVPMKKRFAEMIVGIAEGVNGDKIVFCQDDTLISKGADVIDLIVITNPELTVPDMHKSINTNIFATLTPNQQAAGRQHDVHGCGCADGIPFANA